ncbi:hypothetical protein ACLGIH_00095 [Streptomyces sp. HMX87]
MQRPRHLIRALLSAVLLVVGLMAFPATASATTTADPLPTGCVDVSDDATVRITCKVTVDLQVVDIDVRCDGHDKPGVNGTTLIFNEQRGTCKTDIETAAGKVSIACMGSGPNSFEFNTATLTFKDYSRGQCNTTVKSAGGDSATVDTKGSTETEIVLTATTIEVTSTGPATVSVGNVTFNCANSNKVRVDLNQPLGSQVKVTGCNY